MRFPLQIMFRNMKSSENVEKWVRAGASKLDTFYNRVMGCRVAIEMPHRHHKKGRIFHIRIDLTVPGEEIVVNHEPGFIHHTRESEKTQLKKQLEVTIPHKNLGLAINDAFKAASRRLQDYARRQRGEVKSHTPLQVALVSKIVPDQAYGFLTSEDGREIYFHRNSVLHHDFSLLKVGTRVGFVQKMGDKGPQASTVRMVGKRNVLHRATPSAA